MPKRRSTASGCSPRWSEEPSSCVYAARGYSPDAAVSHAIHPPALAGHTPGALALAPAAAHRTAAVRRLGLAATLAGLPAHAVGTVADAAAVLAAGPGAGRACAPDRRHLRRPARPRPPPRGRGHLRRARYPRAQRHPRHRPGRARARPGRAPGLGAGPGARAPLLRPPDDWSPGLATGQVVEAGTPLGTVGDTGNARGTPPHLHYGIYGGAGALDPLPRMRAAH